MLPDSAFRNVDKIDVNYKRMHLTVKRKPAVRKLPTAGVVDSKGFEPSTSTMRM